MIPIRLVLLTALLAICSATSAWAQEVSVVTYSVEGRTIQCTTTRSGAQQTSECNEVNGPYKSTCVTTNGATRQQRCTDNYGRSWDPNTEAAPSLPPASQPPGTPQPPSPPPPPPPPPPTAGPCSFQLGFKTLHDLIPDVVGDCIANETYNPQNGDGLQQTTKGLLVWRKVDNWTAFTNGSTTWINGPNGLQSRPNNQRFPWEGPGT